MSLGAAGAGEGPSFPAVRWRTVALAAVVAAFAFQGSRPLWEPDEGRYTMVALQMLRHDNYLEPQLNPALPEWAKPPLTAWVIAGSMGLLGRNEWAVRLPYALAFAATLLLIYGMGRRLVAGAPWLPAAVYGTSLLPFLAANVVTTDTLLTLFETLAIFGFVESRCAAEPLRRRGFLDLMWLGWGLAFLTKGPPGMLPMLAVLLFVAWVDGWRRLPRLLPIEGLAVFVLVGLGWFLVVIARQPELLSYFLGYELKARLFSGVHRRHAEWYGAIEVYLPTLLAGSLPYTGIWLRALRPRDHPWWRREHWRRLARREPWTLFLLLWILLPLAVFCVAGSRLHLYVLPLFAPLALLIAQRLEDGPRPVLERRFQGLLVWVGVLVLLKAGAAWAPVKKDARAFAAAVTEQGVDDLEEVIFAEAGPRYGLGFYLGLEVRVVTFYDDDPHPLADKASGTLAQVLAEPAGPRLFVVQPPHVAAFERVLGNLGYSYRQTGRWEDQILYAVEPEPEAMPSRDP